jgi:hypothetical protein
METVEKKKNATKKNTMGKPLDTKKFLGAVKWSVDPVKYQRQIRDGK